jgi:phage shock protein PspC (stress-responsive transcriptional regulator)
MKKNISINISGIIFHIEEDGYETLKKYLDSINKYFSTFEDSSEILADIESRIAEIFLSKLNEEKQVITSEDVQALVSTMGSVSDFRAVEEEADEPIAEPAPEAKKFNYENASAPPPPNHERSESPRKLLRDQKRKVLGGVCSGLANYFNIDALWIRLLFALLTFAYGITLIVYIIMWIVVPGSYDLDEPVISKKMYRDPQRKILGGVSGGAAAFLGIDIIAVRVLFIVFTLAGGMGIFIYIVLWLVLPEAKSLTDKMQMQGEPVTLSNIESTLKKSQSEKTDDESTLTRIILFPFRLLGMILTALGRVLGPLVEVVRVGIGIIIVLIGLSLMFGFMVAAGVLFGLISSSAFSIPWSTEITEASIPVDVLLRAFPSWTAIAAFFGTIVPTIFIILVGASIIAKRIVFNATAGWTLFVIFFVSVAVLAVGIPKIVFAFREDAEYRVEQSYRVNGKRAVLRLNETGMDNYDAVRLDLQGHRDPNFRLVQNFEAQGSTRAKAISNAKMVDYQVNFADSIFTFDSNLRFKDDAIFRAQRLNMTLYIPYNFPFTMDEGTSRFIRNMVRAEYLDGYTWAMTEENGLTCLSCPESYQDEERSRDLADFDELEIKGKFDVRIVSGHEYSVKINGPESAKNQYDIHRVGETLIIDYNGKRDFDWKLPDLKIQELEIIITTPRLKKIEAVGYGNIRMDDFHFDDLYIDLRGPIKLRGDIAANNLTISLTGASEVDLSGSAHNMNAQLELASRLRAYNLEVQDAFVETSGSSTAKVNVRGNLEIEQGISSDIDYRGNPAVTRRD